MKDLNKTYFLKLLQKYRLGNATPKEVNFLEKYYELFEVNEDYKVSAEELLQLKDSIKKNIDQQVIFEGQKTAPVIFKSIWIKYAAAAAVILFSVTAYLFIKPAAHSDQLTEVHQDIAPGGNKAILTLENGKTIILDDAVKGEILKQSGISITKTTDGQVVYNVQPELQNKNQSATLYNTISTPNGGQYTIILSDGTKVMLNSASSLTFPTTFGKERRIELVGEAYFEVTKNKDAPFRVISGMQTVEVLGTHFNVNAYANEQTIKTTLLEGAVSVFTGGTAAVIAPGEQAVVKKDNPLAIIKNKINTDKEIAWVNGIFSFENDDLASVMRQIARWYDVDVIYNDNNLSDEKYFGEISKNSKLSEVLKILELNNVQFVVTGKTIKVSYNQRSSLINAK